MWCIVAGVIAKDLVICFKTCHELINIKLLFPCELQVTLRFAHGLEKAVSQQQGKIQNVALISVLFFVICSTPSQ